MPLHHRRHSDVFLEHHSPMIIDKCLGVYATQTRRPLHRTSLARALVPVSSWVIRLITGVTDASIWTAIVSSLRVMSRSTSLASRSVHHHQLRPHLSLPRRRVRTMTPCLSMRTRCRDVAFPRRASWIPALLLHLQRHQHLPEFRLSRLLRRPLCLRLPRPAHHLVHRRRRL